MSQSGTVEMYRRSSPRMRSPQVAQVTRVRTGWPWCSTRRGGVPTAHFNPDTIAPAVREAGEVDVLVSNAGEIFYAAVEATPPGEFARLLEVNTIGALRVAQAVLPGMRARGRGRLLFLSSVAGRIALPPGAAYAATKWALEALVEALAIEAGPLGIKAALLEPTVLSRAASFATAVSVAGVDLHRNENPRLAAPGRGGGVQRRVRTTGLAEGAVLGGGRHWRQGRRCRRHPVDGAAGGRPRRPVRRGSGGAHASR